MKAILNLITEILNLIINSLLPEYLQEYVRWRDENYNGDGYLYWKHTEPTSIDYTEQQLIELFNQNQAK